MAKIEIDYDGTYRFLHNDIVPLLGPSSTQRVSNVERNNATGFWEVRSRKTGKVLRDDFKTRKDALAWEVEQYGVGGPLWEEAKSL